MVVLKHEKSLDNLNDLILKVSGHDFEDIESTVANFVRYYNRSLESRGDGDKKVFDWFIADRRDLAEMDTQVYSYAPMSEEDE